MQEIEQRRERLPGSAEGFPLCRFKKYYEVNTMNKPNSLAVILMSSLLLSVSAKVNAGNSNELNVEARTWATMNLPTKFPEISEYAIPYLKDKEDFGIAISGGGTRSASAAIGQLRAMKELGWLSKARYISASSGGAWAAVPYLYKPDSINDDIFLGPYVVPEDITLNVIKDEGDERSLGYVIHSIGTIVFSGIAQIWRGNESYGRVMGKKLLAPLGIEIQRFFTFDDAAKKQVLGRQNEKVNNVGMTSVSASRELPYPIITATAYPTEDGKWKDIYPVEMTPLYTGIRASSEKLKEIGGGYIESFAYDACEREGDFTVGEESLYKVHNKGSRFTLADIVGTTGAAPVRELEFISGLPNASFPKFYYQTIASANKEIIKKLPHGDGGLMDNLALFPLFNRRVQNILVFINTSTKFEMPKGEIKEQKNAKPFKKISGDLVSYFNINGSGKSYHPVRFPHNGVIKNGKQKLGELIEKFNNLKGEGLPLVHCDNYDVGDSPRYGLSGTELYSPNICWVYLARSEKWINTIRENAHAKELEYLLESKGDFKRFPHYRTLGEKKLKLIDLSAAQVNAMSQLTDWTVRASKAYLAEKMELDTTE